MQVRSGTAQGQEGAKAQHRAKAKSRATTATPLTTPARVKVPTHLTTTGMPAQCMIMVGAKRCANPSRHPWTHGRAKVWTCTTHGKRVAVQGTQGYKWATSDNVAYDPTLWGGTLPTPKATPKAKAKMAPAHTPSCKVGFHTGPCKATPKAKATPKVAPKGHSADCTGCVQGAGPHEDAPPMATPAKVVE